MNQKITIEAHIREMPYKSQYGLYKVVLLWQEGGNIFTDDNNGKGYMLHQATALFAILQKTCVGEYEIPTKMAR